MNTSEIITLISALCSAASAIAATISCLLHYRFIKPKIKMDIFNPDCSYFYSKIDNTEVKCAYMPVRIYNPSAAGGTIGGIEIVYKKHRYSVETASSKIGPWLHINFTGPLKQDSEALRLKVPLVVPAYSAMAGYFLFPDFPIVNDNKIFVDVKIKSIDNKLKVKTIKNVLFSLNYNLVPKFLENEEPVSLNEN